MSCDNPTDRGPSGPTTPAGEDRKTQSAILAFLLNEHPTCLTVAELALEMCGWREDGEIERAVRELVGAGLLRHEGEVVLPTRAALCFDRLETE